MLLDYRIRWVERFKRQINWVHNGMKNKRVDFKNKTLIVPYSKEERDEFKKLKNPVFNKNSYLDTEWAMEYLNMSRSKFDRMRKNYDLRIFKKVEGAFYPVEKGGSSANYYLGEDLIRFIQDIKSASR